MGSRNFVSAEEPGRNERASTQSEASKRPHPTRKPLGVYVHFPYCRRKCPYCDFVSYKTELPDIPHARYADAVIAELDARLSSTSEHELATMFFGGGTPSLWEPRELGRVVRAIEHAFEGRSAADVEITVECNPTSLDQDRATALREAGANRLSIGVQALDADRLAFLGREHTPDEALRALEAALASGIERVSADLIFGVATGAAVESPAEAADEAARVASTGVTHVSAYALTIESNTEFGHLARKGKLPLATDDTVVESLFAVADALSRHGLSAYETSNYAAPGHACRHNLGYWRGADYLGLGAGAFGTLSEGARAHRYRNAADPRRYMALAATPAELSPDPEAVEPAARMNERIMLGLRLTEGVDLDEAARDLSVDPLPPERARAVEELVRRGRLVRDGGRLVVPPEKRALVDGIAATLFV